MNPERQAEQLNEKRASPTWWPGRSGVEMVAPVQFSKYLSPGLDQNQPVHQSVKSPPLPHFSCLPSQPLPTLGAAFVQKAWFPSGSLGPERQPYPATFLTGNQIRSSLKKEPRRNSRRCRGDRLQWVLACLSLDSAWKQPETRPRYRRVSRR